MNQRPTVLLVIAAAMASQLLLVGCSKPSEAKAAVAAPLPATGAVSDVDVTHQVKAGLSQNESLRQFDIIVMTTQGDVRMYGMLDSQAQVKEAIKIARAAQGTQSIRNELTVRR
jgi:hyperosmotically inducible periplasmic protein